MAVTWLAIRCSGPGLWIGAMPVLLAVLWKVFENLALLLPNTLCRLRPETMTLIDGNDHTLTLPVTRPGP